jgi:hypothetical protein
MPKYPGPTTHRSPTPKERNVMEPKEITEELRRHDEYTPQALAGGRS